MIDLLGFLYDVAKDLKEYFEWKEEDKLVDFKWPEKSGLKDKAAADGLTISWCKPDRLESRRLDGYEIVYEVDKADRVRRRIVLRDGLVLIGKRSQP